MAVRSAILGASGYTGAEMVRLLAEHSDFEISAVSAHSLAGKHMGDVFPHLTQDCDLELLKADDIEWSNIEAVFSCLPHKTSQDIIAELPAHVRVVDLSADYRFRDVATYENAYKVRHREPERLQTAVYGLTEHYRPKVKEAQLVACPGCYPTATLLCLLPLIGSALIKSDPIIIDAKSGVSGAGRGLKEGNLFSEVAEGLHPYGIGVHRHTPEIEQELSLAGSGPLQVTFTPHLVPMTRGELVTCYVALNGCTVADVHAHLSAVYEGEAFVNVRALGDMPPDTRHVRGTNRCEISVHADRVDGRAIIVGAIDNLIKGSAGQALQNANLMFGFEEGKGLSHLKPLFP